MLRVLLNKMLSTKYLLIVIIDAFIVMTLLTGASWCIEDLGFPPGFQFGASTSSYQIEGGWNASDKGVSIWDTFVHDNPAAISDGSTGDVACDSYNLWRRDVEMAAELGLDFYRFSVSWTRILPSGYDNHISEDGKNYYNNLINGLLEKGIEPVVTLYHCDLPQTLQNLGGLTNPLMADWFADYSRVVYSLYGDRVKTWITINEPLIVCDIAYNMGTLAPGIVDLDRGMYLCSKNLLLAHAKAWRVYDEEFRAKYQGVVSIVNQLFWYEGEDQSLVDLALQYANGRFAHPIYTKEGGWPVLIEEAIAKKSKEEGYSTSKLPAFTEEEKKLVRGTYDFFGLNYYYSFTVRATEAGEEPGLWPMEGSADLDIVLGNPSGAKFKASGRALIPRTLRSTLNWIREQYGDVGILITENGYPGRTDGDLKDIDKADYYREYLEQVQLAIKEDKVNVTGYSIWSLMDDFEWSSGYTHKFGLYAVDFSSSERTRTPRLSASFYAEVIKTRSLNLSFYFSEG